MEKVDESHQKEIQSLHSSKLADQIYPSILPDIHFLPSNSAEPRSWCQSGEENVYWDFFKQILKCQSTSSNELSISARQCFRELPFHEQLATFELSQQLTKDQSRIRWQIAVDVLSVIRKVPELENCDAFVFGSLLTGLSKPVSDIDISVDIDGENGQIHGCKSKEERRNISSHFPGVLEEILSNALSPHDPAQKLFSSVRLCGEHFEYIWLREAQTEVTMELTFDNQLSIRNTELLQFYLKFEPSIKHLIIFLNYWTKFHKITGKKHKMSKWALTLLIMVFFMEKKMIPSVLLLQAIATFQRSERGKNDIQDTHEPYFCDDRDVISKYFTPAVIHGSINKPDEDAQFFLQLLTEFFEKIKNTKFSISLVSPQLGQFVRKKDVAKTVSKCVDALPAEVGDHWRKLNPNYFPSENLFSDNAAAIFIQDSCLPSSNTAKRCSKKDRDRFVVAAKHTLSILKTNPFTLLDLLQCPFKAQADELAELYQRSEGNRYLQILLELYSKMEPEEAVIYKENTACEIIQTIGNTIKIPGGLFEDPDKFSAIRLNRSTCFLDRYLAKLYYWNMLGGSNDVSSWQIKCQVTALWRRSAIQFLNEFFTKGLLLPEEGIAKHEVNLNSSISLAETWTYDSTYTDKCILNWNAKAVHKLVDVSRIEFARRKIEQVSIPEKAIKYGVFRIKVTYPFWRRTYVPPKSRKCPLDEEADVSLQSYGKQLNDSKEVAEGETGQASDFSPFFMYILYKLNARADEANKVCGESSITFVVQELSDDDVPREIRLERLLASKCVINILHRRFETYQFYKLSEWIETELEI